MMKKWIVFALCFCLLLGTLCACGEAAPKADEKEPAAESTEESVEESEGDAEEIGMPNPMMEVASLEELNALTYGRLCRPAVMGVTDESFFTIDCGDYVIAEYDFSVNGIAYCFRFSDSFTEDISGIYVEDGTLFEGEVEDGAVLVFDGGLASRTRTVDGQYVLSVAQQDGEPTEEIFAGIAQELFFQVIPVEAGGEGEMMAGMPNPMTEVDSLEEVNALTYGRLCRPPVMGITDEAFYTIDCADYVIGQYNFSVNGIAYCFRFSDHFTEDISGIYVEDGTLFEGEVEDGAVLAFDGGLAARTRTVDGQYVLSVAQQDGEPSEETFAGIAQELFSLVVPDESEGDAEGIGMANPMTEVESLEELNELTGGRLCHPPVMGVTDESFFTIDCGDYVIAEYDFSVNGIAYCFRFSDSFTEDISGIYVEDGTLFEGEVEDGAVLAFDGGFAARTRTVDGQYVLSVAQQDGEPTEEIFSGMAEEAFTLVVPAEAG